MSDRGGVLGVEVINPLFAFGALSSVGSLLVLQVILFSTKTATFFVEFPLQTTVGHPAARQSSQPTNHLCIDNFKVFGLRRVRNDFLAILNSFLEPLDLLLARLLSALQVVQFLFEAVRFFLLLFPSQRT